MTQEQIIESNKLIAEFMGLKRDKGRSTFDGRWANDWFDDGGVINGQRNNILLFHESWDWLMPVLERIEAKGYRWEIGMSTTSPYHYCKIWSIGTIEGISPLDAVYGAVLEFINWYNENKKT